MFVFFSVPDSELKSRPDTKDFALKQIEGTGLSMSACREITVSLKKICSIIVKLKKIVFCFCSFSENSNTQMLSHLFVYFYLTMTVKYGYFLILQNTTYG